MQLTLAGRVEKYNTSVRYNSSCSGTAKLT